MFCGLGWRGKLVVSACNHLKPNTITILAWEKLCIPSDTNCQVSMWTLCSMCVRGIGFGTTLLQSWNLAYLDLEEHELDEPPPFNQQKKMPHFTSCTTTTTMMLLMVRMMMIMHRTGQRQHQPSHKRHHYLSKCHIWKQAPNSHPETKLIATKKSIRLITSVITCKPITRSNVSWS